MSLIEGVDLEKVYEDGTRALRGASITIDEKESVAIMGPSGSGKSTLLHILGLLDYQTKGQYLFNGKRVADYSQEELAHMRNKMIGFVFQTFNLLPRASALDNVKLPLLYSDISESEWNDRAKKALEAVGLSHRESFEPSKLSGGERQRVAIARALITDPQIIFADEPTGNLDSKTGNSIMGIFQKLNNEGRTIVIITHEIHVAQYAKRIIYIKDGKVESDEKVKTQVINKESV